MITKSASSVTLPSTEEIVGKLGGITVMDRLKYSATEFYKDYAAGLAHTHRSSAGFVVGWEISKVDKLSSLSKEDITEIDGTFEQVIRAIAQEIADDAIKFKKQVPDYLRTLPEIRG